MTHDMLGVNLYTCPLTWFDLSGVRTKYEVAHLFLLMLGWACSIYDNGFLFRSASSLFTKLLHIQAMDARINTAMLKPSQSKLEIKCHATRSIRKRKDCHSQLVVRDFEKYQRNWNRLLKTTMLDWRLILKTISMLWNNESSILTLTTCIVYSLPKRNLLQHGYKFCYKMKQCF